MIYKPTSASALEFASAGRVEEWVHLFLRGEGFNKAFSDGLKLKPRRFYPPELLELNRVTRCCGPEESMKYQIPKDCFGKRVYKIAEKYAAGGWDMPPLIIGREQNIFTLNDGNHRYEALKTLGIIKYWVIVWETVD